MIFSEHETICKCRRKELKFQAGYDSNIDSSYIKADKRTIFDRRMGGKNEQRNRKNTSGFYELS